MGKLRSVYKLFEGRHFDREVIIVCAGTLTFPRKSGHRVTRISPLPAVG